MNAGPVSPEAIGNTKKKKKYFLFLSNCIAYQGCYSKIPQIMWLKQEKFIFLQFWRLWVQSQGVTVGFFLSLSPWLADHFSLCALVFPLCRHVSGVPLCVLITSYYKDTSHTGEGHGNPLQYSCLENPMDRGGWRVHGMTEWGKTEWLILHIGSEPTQGTSF